MTEYNFRDFIPYYGAKGTNFNVDDELCAKCLVDLRTGINYILFYNFDYNYKNVAEYSWGYGWGYGGPVVRLMPDGKPFIFNLDEIKKICQDYIANRGKKLGVSNCNFYLPDGLYQIKISEDHFNVVVDAGKPVNG